MHKRDIYWWAALAGIIAAVLACCGVSVAIGNWLFPFSPRPWAQATPAQTESVALVPSTRAPTLTSTSLFPEESPTPTELKIVAPGDWVQVGLSGDTITDIAVADADTLYVATLGYNHGIFKSSDGGTSWTAINNGLGSLEVYDLDISSIDSNRVIAATYGGLWLALDGGQRWQFWGPDDIWMISVSSLPSNPSTITVVGAANYGPFITFDGGHTWRKHYDMNHRFYGISLRHADSASQPSPTIYLIGFDQIFRSSDGGNLWNQVADVGASYYVSAIEVDPRNADVVYACTGLRREDQSPNRLRYDEGFGLYKSTDGGGSWFPINNGLPNQGYETQCTAVTVNPDDSNSVYVAMNGQVYTSNDGGESWSQLSSLPEEVWPIHSLALNSASNTLCSGTEQNGVWCISVTNGMNYTPAISTMSISPTDTPVLSTDTPSPSRGDLGTPVGGGEPSFSNLFFAAGVTDAGEPVDVATEFPGETTIVYAFVTYEGMSDGAQCESVWYLHGEEALRNVFDWALGESGATWIAYVSDDSGLTPGRYDWELYVEGKLVVTGGFVVR